MPFATEAQITKEAPLSDLEQGRWLYRNELDIAKCTSEAMRVGWRLEEAAFVEWFSLGRKSRNRKRAPELCLICDAH